MSNRLSSDNWVDIKTSLSDASEDEIDSYCYGLCHVFALSLHRLTGWKMAAILDHGNPWHIDEDDPDSSMPSVVHVFCIDDDNNFWDIRGYRPHNVVQEEMEEWVNIDQYGIDYLNDEGELRYYSGDADDDISYPLVEIVEDEVSEAKDVAIRILNYLNVNLDPTEQVQPYF